MIRPRAASSLCANHRRNRPLYSLQRFGAGAKACMFQLSLRDLFCSFASFASQLPSLFAGGFASLATLGILRQGMVRETTINCLPANICHSILAHNVRFLSCNDRRSRSRYYEDSLALLRWSIACARLVSRQIFISGVLYI